MCHKERNVDKRSAFYKQCASAGVVFESVRPRDYEIGPWLSSFIASRGLRISPKAAQMLTDITDGHIESNVGISKDFNNFELCNAVARRDVARAMGIADHFARNPKDNPLLLTIMALFGQFRDMFVVNYLRWQAKYRGKPFPDDTELMRVLKKSNIFAVREVKELSAKWNNRSVFNILGLLREYDGKSKGIDAGAADDGELLRELLLKIFAS